MKNIAIGGNKMQSICIACHLKIKFKDLLMDDFQTKTLKIGCK